MHRKFEITKGEFYLFFIPMRKGSTVEATKTIRGRGGGQTVFWQKIYP